MALDDEYQNKLANSFSIIAASFLMSQERKRDEQAVENFMELWKASVRIQQEKDVDVYNKELKSNSLLNLLLPDAEKIEAYFYNSYETFVNTVEKMVYADWSEMDVEKEIETMMKMMEDRNEQD
jgi:hypothetical protein